MDHTIDITKAFEMMTDTAREARQDYHVGLKELITFLSTKPLDMPIEANNGQYVGVLDSYRGYYDDLAFEPNTHITTCGEVLEICESAIGQVFTGYKGGKYVGHDKTPLWMASYGCEGRAIVAVIDQGDKVVLWTKTV